jgi:hypothetical protein
MRLRHWIVVLFVLPASAGGASLIALQTTYAVTLLGWGPNTEVVIFFAAGGGLFALVYSFSMRAGLLRGLVAATGCFFLTFPAFVGWLFVGLFAWAYFLCEPGTHDMCLRGR